MNNCIGYFNQKYFVLFLAYGELACAYSVILLIIRATYCKFAYREDLCDAPSEENSVDILIGLISFMLLILFALFMAIMIHDQFKCIANNTSAVDIAKNEIVVQRPKMVNFSEVFGGKIGVRWFFPCFKVPGTAEVYLSHFNSV